MIIYLAFVVFGLIIGSFANALIYRLPRRISLLSPRRSHCPNCEKEIRAIDNIPILSWIILKGKCRSCNNPISVKYPIVEALNCFAAFYSIHHYQNIPTAILAYLIISLLIVITIIDLEFMIIPDKINKPGMVFGLILGLLNQNFNIFEFPFSPSIIDSAVGLAFGYGILFVIAWGYYKATGVSGLGGGDIKLMGFMGALFGPYAIPSILITGSFIGVIVGIIVIIIKKYSARTELPFGPSLAAGILIYMLGIDTISIINYYSIQFIAPSLING